MATYAKVLKDSSDNTILPYTRASLVYMDNDSTVESSITSMYNTITSGTVNASRVAAVLLSTQYGVFTQTPQEMLPDNGANAGFRNALVVVSDSNTSTYSPQPGNYPQWFNVITFGFPGRVTQIACSCFDVALSGTQNNQRRAYIRFQHDTGVTSWYPFMPVLSGSTLIFN